jgi:LPXTG-motif cell wall-anchored protein
MMRRISAVVTLTFASLLVTAGAAMAQTSSYPVSPSPTTIVKGASGTRGGGTAFTGSSQIPFLTLMIVALVVAGVAALFVARRRAARFAG